MILHFTKTLKVIKLKKTIFKLKEFQKNQFFKQKFNLRIVTFSFKIWRKK